MARLLVLIVYIINHRVFALTTNENCGDPNYGPVAQGIDFVDLLNGYNRNNQTLEPKQGSNKFTAKYEDYTFWFLNDTNLELFKSNPIKYRPKYGCYCSWTLTGNDQYCPMINNNTQKWCIGPLCTFTQNGYAIYDDTIYCFCGSGAKGDFNYHPSSQQNIQSADENWTTYLEQQNVQNCFNTQYFNNNTECLA